MALDRLISYLSERIQTVDINWKRSIGAAVTIGVPQGFILGPFLFLIYINDVSYFVKDTHGIVPFADDSSLLFKVNRQIGRYEELNNAIL